MNHDSNCHQPAVRRWGGGLSLCLALSGMTSAWGEDVIPGSSVADSGQQPQAPRPIPPPADDNVCGVNSLYMFLRAWGVDDLSAARVQVDTPRNAQGTSMYELQQTAREFGVETAVYKCGVEDLGTNCPLPAIGLFKPGGRTGGGIRHYAAHYSLIIDVEAGPDGNVTWIDGTFGDRFIRPKSEFTDRWWAEHVLVARQGPGTDPFWITLAMLGTIIHGYWWARLARTRDERHPESVRRVGTEQCTA